MKRLAKNLLLVLAIILTVAGQPVFAEDNFDAYVYNHLENWDTEFEISYYKSDVLELIQSIAKKDDYLTRSISKLVYERKGDKATIKITYKTTKEQEQYINEELIGAVNSMVTNQMSDYDKVKVINDYLANRYQYDKTLVSNNAYSALTTGKTTCQGYAMTAYKMLNLAGIENKIIIGDLDGIPHGWNLVKIDGKWYHLDVTNNDALGNYKYFLRCDEALRDDGFTWETKDYPICKEDYSESNGRQNILLSNSNNIDSTRIQSGNSGQASIELKSYVDGKWCTIKSSWYFLLNTGNYATGWNRIDSNWYYLGNDGDMKTGWIYSGGKWYYCYPTTGVMAINTIIDGYKINSSGTWVE